MNNTEQFKNRSEGFKEVRNKIFIRTIPVFAIAAFGGVAMGEFNNSSHQTNANVLVMTILIVSGSLILGTYRSISRQKQLFDTYRLRFDNGNIVREQHNTPTISIPEDEISSIFKSSNGGFVIKSNISPAFIMISTHIEDHERVEERLRNIKEFSPVAANLALQKIKIILYMVLPLVLMAAVYVSKNKIVVGLGGTVLLAVFAYGFYAMQINKNLDNKTKRGRWWIIWVAISIVAVMYFKLTAP